MGQEIFLVARSVVAVVVVVVFVRGKRTHACVKHITVSDVQFTHFFSSPPYTFTGPKIDILLRYRP